MINRDVKLGCKHSFSSAFILYRHINFTYPKTYRLFINLKIFVYRNSFFYATEKWKLSIQFLCRWWLNSHSENSCHIIFETINFKSRLIFNYFDKTFTQKLNNFIEYLNKNYIYFFYPTAQSITLTYLPDMAVANGIPRDKSASIISICGITNTIGRILAGFLTDSFHVSSTTIYLVALTVAAVTNFLFPWCYNYLTIALCSGVFGLCMGKFWVWSVGQFDHIVEPF